MTKKELIEKLKDFPDDMRVYVKWMAYTNGHWETDYEIADEVTVSKGYGNEESIFIS
jgi:hypothetical protein